MWGQARLARIRSTKPTGMVERITASASGLAVRTCPSTVSTLEVSKRLVTGS